LRRDTGWARLPRNKTCEDHKTGCPDGYKRMVRINASLTNAR
jgi:hypothetical protein